MRHRAGLVNSAHELKRNSICFVDVGFAAPVSAWATQQDDTTHKREHWLRKLASVLLKCGDSYFRFLGALSGA